MSKTAAEKGGDQNCLFFNVILILALMLCFNVILTLNWINSLMPIIHIFSFKSLFYIKSQFLMEYCSIYYKIILIVIFLKFMCPRLIIVHQNIFPSLLKTTLCLFFWWCVYWGKRGATCHSHETTIQSIPKVSSHIFSYLTNHFNCIFFSYVCANKQRIRSLIPIL